MDTIFYFTGYHMLVLQRQQLARQQYRINQQNEFSADEIGLAGFAKVLQKIQQPVRLIVDIIEEDFRIISIPKLKGRNRRHLQKRYLDKFYHEFNYRYLEVQKQQIKAHRREEITLISALTNNELLAPWLKIIQQHKQPLVGIYSLPIVMEKLLPAMVATTNQATACQGAALVISQNGPSTMRQSFYQQGQLKLSRLATAQLKEDTFDTISAETDRTIRFLENQRLLDKREQLNVFVIAPTDQHGEWMQRLLFIPDLKIDFVDQAQLARQVDLQVNAKRFNAALFAHILQQQKHYTAHYQSSEDQRYYRYHQYQQRLKTASLGLGGITFFLASYLGLQNYLTHQQLPLLQQEAARYDELFAQATVAATDLDIDVDELEETVNQVEYIQQQRISNLSAGWYELSQVLTQYQDIYPMTVRWLTQANSQQLTQFTDKPVDTRGNSRLPQALSLKAFVQNFSNNPRLAVEAVLAFASALRTQPSIRSVTIERMPFDIAPNARLTGQTVVSSAQADKSRAEFDLLILID